MKYYPSQEFIRNLVMKPDIDVKSFYLVHLPTWLGSLLRKDSQGKYRIGRGSGNPAQKTHQFLMTLGTSYIMTWLTVQVVLNWVNIKLKYATSFKHKLC